MVSWVHRMLLLLLFNWVYYLKLNHWTCIQKESLYFFYLFLLCIQYLYLSVLLSYCLKKKTDNSPVKGFITDHLILLCLYMYGFCCCSWLYYKVFYRKQKKKHCIFASNQIIYVYVGSHITVPISGFLTLVFVCSAPFQIISGLHMWDY